LAQRIERSEGWLVQVENGRADPSYGDLQNLASALKQHVSQLVPAAPVTALASQRTIGPLDLTEPIDVAGVGVPTGVLDFDGLAIQMQQFGRHVHTDSPRHLLSRLHGHLGYLRGILGDPQPATTLRQLQRVTSETATVAGYLSYRLHNYGDAEAYLTYADRLASEAGDGPLRAMAMIARSALYSPVPHGGFGGDPSTALALLETAERVAGRSAPKLLLTWLYARRVEDYAGHGDADASDHSLELAERTFQSVRARDDGFFYNWTAARLIGYRGSAAILLGRSGEAINIVEKPLHETPATIASERSFLLISLASAYAQQRHVHEASALLKEALQLAIGAGLTERIRRIRGTRRKYLHGCSDSPSLRELDSQLRTV
jgi:transcriptional regulator with XRE-family HTH domain